MYPVSTTIAMPNPFSNELTIQLDKKYTQAQVQFIGMKGQIMAQQKGSAQKPIVFCGENLSPERPRIKRGLFVYPKICIEKNSL